MPPRIAPIFALCIALFIAFGPWVWAFLVVQADPRQADAQGAFSLATYISFLTFPAALVILIIGLLLSGANKRS